ncbi:MAG: LamG-like jellyroll fold domain-containing protein [Alphaproteobacteria bacterium]
MMLGFADFMMGSSGFTCDIDPLAASRVLFIRGMGANNTQPATDELGNALTWVSNGSISTAAGDSAWPSYGSSIRINYPNDPTYIQSPRASNFSFPGDFTMRARIKRDAINYCTIFAHEAYNGSENGNFVFRMLPDGMEFRAFDAGGANQEQVIVNNITMTDAGSFIEVEACRASGFMRLSYNGNVIASGNLAKALGSTANNAVRLGIGTTGGQFTPTCYADAIIFKGVNAHTGSYTPATQPPC